MDNVFKEINDRINIRQIIEYYHQPINRNNKVSCPLHHDKTPSLSVDEKNNMFNCFSAGCNFGGDGIKFVARLKNIDNIDAAKMICKDFNLQINFESKELNDKQKEIKKYIVSCQKDLDKTDYLQKRGLTTATLKQFGVGFDIKRNAVVIPYSSNYTYYQTRNIIDKKFFKPKTEDAGEEPLWNENALRRNSRSPIFIVESPICAMSIMQYGGIAISLCGKGNIKKLVEKCKTYKPIAPLILCLDNDEAGQTATEQLVEMLRDIDIKHVVFNIADYCKDPNELLMKNADRLCNRIHQAHLQAKRLYKGSTDVILAEDLYDTEIAPVKWVAKDYIPEGLTIIVASSKIGKSWMMMQLANAIVEKKTFLDQPTTHSSVLYYALEDQDRRLKSRMNKVWNNKRPSPGAMFKVEAKRLDNGLIEDLEKLLKTYKNLKVIIFDTFQKIRGQALKNESAYAYDYREMAILKNFADKYGISIILIHHTRKMLDENDVFNMTSGSTAIMGASDTSIIIYKKKRNDEYANLHITGRDVFSKEIVITRSEENGCWSVVGSPEEQEAKRKEEEFKKNPIAKTLLALSIQQSSGWSGTVRQLANIHDKLFPDEALVETESAIGKMLSNYDFERKIFKATRWEHSTKRKNNGMIHIFAPIQRAFWNENSKDFD